MIYFIVSALFSAPAASQGWDIMTLSTASAITSSQLYSAEGLRDPFVEPSTAAAKSSGARISATKAAPPKAENLRLTGILITPEGKQAMLRDSSTGLAYFLIKGRLYDTAKKPVAGISGTAQDRQVTLVTSQRTVFELKLKGGKK